MRRAIFSALIVLTICLAVALTAGGGDASRPAPAAMRHVQLSDPDPLVGLAKAQGVVEYAQALDRQQVGDYIASVMVAEVVHYIEAQQQAAARVAAISTPRMSAPVSSPGAHSDAWWRGVSQCEQGGRDNPTFGYFSIMDGSAAGKSWADQEAEANGIIARYGDRAWAASCVAAGYAASPGG